VCGGTAPPSAAVCGAGVGRCGGCAHGESEAAGGPSPEGALTCVGSLSAGAPLVGALPLDALLAEAPEVAEPAAGPGPGNGVGATEPDVGMGKVGLSEVVGSGAAPPETGADADATADPVRGGMFGHGWAASVAGVGIRGAGGGGVCWWYLGATGGGTAARSIGLYTADSLGGGGVTSGAGGSGKAGVVSLGTGLAPCGGTFSSSGGQNGSTSRSGGVPLVPGT
jgi:hypothetical protein